MCTAYEQRCLDCGYKAATVGDEGQMDALDAHMVEHLELMHGAVV